MEIFVEPDRRQTALYTECEGWVLRAGYLFVQTETESTKCLMHFTQEKLIDRPCHVLRISSLFWHLAFPLCMVLPYE